MKVDVASGKSSPLGKPGIFTSYLPAPDGKHVLVMRVLKPYSYLLPETAFPHSIEVWNLDGKQVHLLAKLPLAENVPIGGVLPGPAAWSWRPDQAATLVWVEALTAAIRRRRWQSATACWLCPRRLTASRK